MTHYVYQYVDPNSGLPFYVGKGSGRRCFKHLWEAQNNLCKNKYLQNVILQVGKPKIEIVQTFETAEDAYALERQLVERYGRRINGTGILTNIDVGGRGRASYIINSETRAKMSAAKLGKKVKRTPEHNAKIAAAHRARVARLKEQAHENS
jgi:hypothetical protein